MDDARAGFQILVEALIRLDIPYVVVGSLASSIHGIYRYTNDIDLLVDLRPDLIDPLAAALSAEFYADPIMMRQSLKADAAFNVIHYASSYKFDLFPLTRDAFARVQFERKEIAETAVFGTPLKVPVASAEDTILSKLAWYKLGGCTSDHQWKDILGVVKVQGNKLDKPYLRKWAVHLQVEDLLEELLKS